MGRFVIALGAAFLVVGCSNDTEKAPDSKEPTNSANGDGPMKPADAGATTISPEIVAAWEKAGAESGRRSINDVKIWNKVDGLHHFSFPYVLKIDMKDLPSPDAPFALSPVQFVEMSDGKVVELQFASLAHFQNLTILDLGRPGRDVDGLKDIAGLTNLRHLRLYRTKMGDAQMPMLKPFTKLEFLSLSVTKVTDAGLDVLAGLPSLRILELTATKVGDGGVRKVANLKSLRSLRLEATAVTDEGLKELKKLESLELLDLDSTAVTDKGIMELVGMKKLRKLQVGGTPVTPEGIARLKAQLPALEVEAK